MIYNMRGDTYHVGPVMLSDVYTSAVGSAKDGVAASQRALYDAYNSLNSRFMKKSFVIYNKDLNLSVGNNDCSFNLPNDFHQSYGVLLVRAWPLSTWTNAYVTMTCDRTLVEGNSKVQLYAGAAQSYNIWVLLLYT